MNDIYQDAAFLLDNSMDSYLSYIYSMLKFNLFTHELKVLSVRDSHLEILLRSTNGMYRDVHAEYTRLDTDNPVMLWNIAGEALAEVENDESHAREGIPLVHIGVALGNNGFVARMNRDPKHRIL
ncbi:MAG: hypothetical protein Q4Q58_07110 [Thermoplasmata archaeon]|nr:hypothetical protein [Thermoplasmata archaeon]